MLYTENTDKKQVKKPRKPTKKAERLLIRLRNRFTAKQTSFNAVCIENGISQSYARKSVLDLVKSDKAKKTKALIIKASL